LIAEILHLHWLHWLKLLHLMGAWRRITFIWRIRGSHDAEMGDIQWKSGWK
jgi:hypothetical protein